MSGHLAKEKLTFNCEHYHSWKSVDVQLSLTEMSLLCCAPKEWFVDLSYVKVGTILTATHNIITHYQRVLLGLKGTMILLLDNVMSVVPEPPWLMSEVQLNSLHLYLHVHWL